MRLLILSQYFWPETFIINDLARLLAERQIEVTVLTGKPNYPGGKIFDGYRAGGIQREQRDGIEVVRVPLLPRGERSGLKLALNYLSFIISASLAGTFALRGRQFDAVLVYAPSPLLKALAGMVIAWRKKAPLVLWVQDLWPESLSATGQVKNEPLLAFVGFLVRAIYRRCDLILVQSRAFVDSVASHGGRREKIEYYPNPYMLPDPSTAGSDVVSLVERLRQSFSVVFAGNIGTAQDPETLLETARLLQDDDIQIVFVGSGSRELWLAEQRTALGLSKLVLAGRFPAEDMPHLFAAASALLVTLAPQPIFALTVPSKLQAYLAAGRPIVAALDGEAARIIAEAEAGLCVPAGKAAELAEAIRRLHRMSQEQREAFGLRGRAYFERNFEPQKLTTDLIAHLEDAIAGKEKAI
jgi:glycosyltransferase involved in cell wall biosynthesis